MSPTAEVASDLLIEGNRIAGIVPSATSTGDDWQAIDGQTPPDAQAKRKGGAMIKDPVVPLSPSLLPQQRLYEVKTLPQWPSGMHPVVGYPGELGVPDLPKRRSRHAIYMC